MSSSSSFSLLRSKRYNNNYIVLICCTCLSTGEEGSLSISKIANNHWLGVKAVKIRVFQMALQVQPKCLHLQHITNNWQSKKRGSLIRFGHTDSNLKKKAKTATIPALQILTHMLFQVWANKLAAPLPSEAENGFSWICILWDLIKRVSKKMAQSNISTRFIFFMQ